MHAPHIERLQYGLDTLSRENGDRSLFKWYGEHGLIDDIRSAVNTGMTLDNSRFKNRLKNAQQLVLSARFLR